MKKSKQCPMCKQKHVSNKHILKCMNKKESHKVTKSIRHSKNAGHYGERTNNLNKKSSLYGN